MQDIEAHHKLTVAEAYLRLLASRGIEYLFANAGSDFPPLIEAFAKNAGSATLPTPITAPHENIAVHMALGHALITGRPQAVMVHVNVGTANALGGLINASRIHVPMLFTAGRTPVLEAGPAGARDLFIHWAQEMYDQAGMVREVVKWDYELRSELQLEAVVDRALALTKSRPAGPVYLTLPREVISRELESFSFSAPQQAPLADGAATNDDIARLAGWIKKAERPVVITAALGQDPAAVDALARLAQAWALPVVSNNPRFVELPSEHPMHMGFDVNPWVSEADLILVMEAGVPWLPGEVQPPQGAKVVHFGVDPLESALPIHSFQTDLALAAEPRIVLRQLTDHLEAVAEPDSQAVAKRRERLAIIRARQKAAQTEAIARDDASPNLTSGKISRAIDRMKGDAIVFKEAPLKIDQMQFNAPGTMFFAGGGGALGWSMGAALGAKLAAPDRLVISTLGDGAYMFGNPVPAHYVAAEQNLPILFIVFNNRGWHSVRRSTRRMYGNGHAAQANFEPLTDFGPDMRFEKIMDVVGGYGEFVERPGQLDAALERALHAVTVEGRQALLNVMCRPG